MLVEQIHRAYFGGRSEKHIHFRFLTTSLEGETAERYGGTGQRIEGIIDGCGHYEAFVKQSTTR